MNLVEQARRLFKKFHRREPKRGEIRVAPEQGEEILLYVGELQSIIYNANGKDYIHDFKASDRPGLYVSSDGQQAYIVAGRYVFTERGFVD